MRVARQIKVGVIHDSGRNIVRKVRRGGDAAQTDHQH
jgi:hypothetical protein